MATLMILNYAISKKRNYRPSRTERVTPREFGRALLDAVWALMVPFGIVMGLRFGAFTPTEAGAISILYAILVGAFIYKELKFAHIKAIIMESLTATAGVMFILAGAQALSAYLTWERIPMMISEAIINGIHSPYLFLLIVNILLLAIGCFFDGGAAMILLAPLLVPVAQSMGINLIHFGIVMCINLTIAGFSPPFGSQMFTTCGICNCRIEDYIRESLPYMGALVGVLLVLTFIPGIVMLVPNLLGAS